MSRLCIYYKSLPEKDRWVTGDRLIRPLIRRIIRGKPKPGGVDKVFINLCKGLDQLKIPYQINLPFTKLKSNDKVGVLGRGKASLNGYTQKNPIVAGIGLMTHPSEWPDLCEQYPVAKYLQHSKWTNNIYKPYFGDRCEIWPVGIDTEFWKPSNQTKQFDVLVYNKIMWDKEKTYLELLQPIKNALTNRGLKFIEIVYGNYKSENYSSLLQQSKSMIFLCEHESQGIAYNEALSTNIPIFAWDQGWCLDPNRFKWGQPEIPATSVPFFDERCGIKFKDLNQFEALFNKFWDNVQSSSFKPREYIIENLTLEKCAQNFISILNEVNN